MKPIAFCVKNIRSTIKWALMDFQETMQPNSQSGSDFRKAVPHSKIRKNS